MIYPLRSLSWPPLSWCFHSTLLNITFTVLLKLLICLSCLPGPFPCFQFLRTGTVFILLSTVFVLLGLIHCKHSVCIWLYILGKVVCRFYFNGPWFGGFGVGIWIQTWFGWENSETYLWRLLSWRMYGSGPSNTLGSSSKHRTCMHRLLGFLIFCMKLKVISLV